MTLRQNKCPACLMYREAMSASADRNAEETRKIFELMLPDILDEEKRIVRKRREERRGARD